MRRATSSGSTFASAAASWCTCWLVSTRAGPKPTSTSPTGVPSDTRKFSGSSPPSREPVSAKWIACQALCSTTRSRPSASAPYRKRVISEGLARRRSISRSEAGRRLPIIPSTESTMLPTRVGAPVTARRAPAEVTCTAVMTPRVVVGPTVVALGLIVLGLGVLVSLIPAAPMTGDGQYYIQFVRNGLQHGASSWHERRLLGPLIVRALPLDAEPGFFVLTTVSLGVTAGLTWLAARALLRDEWRAVIAVPLLFGTWVVAPNLREYGLIDPLAWAFVAGVWLATIRRAWWLAAGVAAVGVLAKEVVVLAAVAAAAAAWQRRQPWVAAGVAAPALLVALLQIGRAH